MIEIFNDRRKYLLLLPLLLAAVSSLYFYYTYQQMETKLVLENFANKKMIVRLLTQNVSKYAEIDKDWDTYNYKDIIIYDVSRIDEAKGTYAELFDEKMTPMSPRAPSFAGNPFLIEKFPDVIARILSNEHGEAIVPFAKDATSSPHDLYLYWEWLPSDTSLKNRYVVLVGVSKYSLNAEIGKWLAYGAIGIILLLAVLLVITIIAQCDIGWVRDFREGDDKYRSKDRGHDGTA